MFATSWTSVFHFFQNCMQSYNFSVLFKQSIEEKRPWPLIVFDFPSQCTCSKHCGIAAHESGNKELWFVAEDRKDGFIVCLPNRLHDEFTGFCQSTKENKGLCLCRWLSGLENAAKSAHASPSIFPVNSKISLATWSPFPAAIDTSSEVIFSGSSSRSRDGLSVVERISRAVRATPVAEQ